MLDDFGKKNIQVHVAMKVTISARISVES